MCVCVCVCVSVCVCVYIYISILKILGITYNAQRVSSIFFCVEFNNCQSFRKVN